MTTAKKTPAKIRGFSIVFHNVRHDCKSSVENYFKSTNPSKIAIGLEPYDGQEGHHLHVFLYYQSQRSFRGMLDSCLDFSKHIVDVCPDETVGSWGRVQVDAMKGTWRQATDYLTNPKKDKICDPDAKDIDCEEDRLREQWDMAFERLQTMYVSAFTGEWTSLKKIIKQYEALGLELPHEYKSLKNVYSKHLPW